MLASFLEQDIQSSVDGCQEFLNAVAAVEQGRREEWRATGNAHTVTIRPTGVTIESEWDPESRPCELTLTEFEQALNDWLSCISPASR